MAKLDDKKDETKVDVETPEALDETAALDSLQPGSKPVGPANKSAQIGKIVNAVAGMDSETINKFVAMIDQIGHEADSIPGGAAAKNKASIDAKEEVELDDSIKAVIKEDVAKLFEGEEMKPEFTERVSVIIESAINLKAAARVAELEEQYDARLTEEVESITEELVAALDTALDSVVGTWLESNEVAITSTLRADLTEQFLEDLHGLFATHYIDVPDDKVDVLEDLALRVEELESVANEALAENAALKKAAEDLAEANAIAEIVAEATEGLVATDAEKLVELSESVDFTSVDDFKSKLSILKETYFSTQETSSSKPSVLFEETEAIEDASETPSLKGPMSEYVRAIERTIR